MSTSKPLCLPTEPHLPMDCPADWHNPEATDRRPRVFVAPVDTQPGADGWVEVGEVTDLRGADDDRPVTEQRLNGQDRATLRWLTGNHTLQDWLDKPLAERAGVSPHCGIASVTPLRMAARLKATQDAQTMIRLCPSAYIPELRP